MSSIHGSGKVSLRLKEIRCFSGSNDLIITFTSWFGSKTSSTLSILFQATSEMCNKPSIPLTSINAPYGMIFFTIPVSCVPCSYASFMFSISVSRWISSIALRLKTKRFFKRSTSSTFAWNVVPTRNESERTKRRSPWESGIKPRNDLIWTRRPALIASIPSTSTGSSLANACSTISQSANRSNLILEM